MMFLAFCPTHDSDRLMTRRHMIDFRNGDDGPVIRWRCDCGHEGTLGRHGSVADEFKLASAGSLAAATRCA
jgi:hypothetical protein